MIFRSLKLLERIQVNRKNITQKQDKNIATWLKTVVHKI